jgi:hypothetical protein
MIVVSPFLSIAVMANGLLRFSAHPRVVGLGPMRSKPVAPYLGDLA